MGLDDVNFFSSKGNGVTGSTGKEAVVFDLFQGTGEALL